MDFTVTLTRTLSKRTSDQTIDEQIAKIVSTGLRGNRGRTWKHTVSRYAAPESIEGGLWRFTRKIRFKKTSHLKKAPEQWEIICATLIKAGQNTSFNKYPWLVSGSGAEKIYEKLTTEGRVAPIATDGGGIVRDDKKSTIPVKNFGSINTDKSNFFDHIYDREHQLKIIHSAIIAAKDSEFHNRFHCVLYGPPGCGKSDILISVGKMLGNENEAYMKLDATSTTEAGAQRILLESSHIPPVLIVEEIEKTDEKSLRWLLGILDHRAEIRKTNFNIGQRAKNVKMLCLATVNDIDLFKRVMSGALHSRFAHEVHCPRPDRNLMEKILKREISTLKGGRVEWIEPTLEFCMDEMEWNDPRKIIPVCLCGRDDLLDGNYQESIRATIPKKK